MRSIERRQTNWFKMTVASHNNTYQPSRHNERTNRTHYQRTGLWSNLFVAGARREEAITRRMLWATSEMLLRKRRWLSFQYCDGRQNFGGFIVTKIKKHKYGTLPLWITESRKFKIQTSGEPWWYSLDSVLRCQTHVHDELLENCVYYEFSAQGIETFKHLRRHMLSCLNPTEW